MSSTMTLTLIQPIEVDGKMIAEVTLRRPKVKDLRAMEQRVAASEPGAISELDESIDLAAVLCALPREAVEELDAVDFARISETIAGFFPAELRARRGGAS